MQYLRIEGTMLALQLADVSTSYIKVRNARAATARPVANHAGEIPCGLRLGLILAAVAKNRLGEISSVS
jgi:hypothetical protein